MSKRPLPVPVGDDDDVPGAPEDEAINHALKVLASAERDLADFEAANQVTFAAFAELGSAVKDAEDTVKKAILAKHAKGLPAGVDALDYNFGGAAATIQAGSRQVDVSVIARKHPNLLERHPELFGMTIKEFERAVKAQLITSEVATAAVRRGDPSVRIKRPK